MGLAWTYVQQNKRKAHQGHSGGKHEAQVLLEMTFTI